MEGGIINGRNNNGVESIHYITQRNFAIQQTISAKLPQPDERQRRHDRIVGRIVRLAQRQARSCIMVAKRRNRCSHCPAAAVGWRLAELVVVWYRPDLGCAPGASPCPA